MNWLDRFILASGPYVFGGLLLLIALYTGVQTGESRVQKAWDAEKRNLAQIQALQEKHVDYVRKSQSQITKEISNEFEKKSKLLLNQRPEFGADGMRDALSTTSWNMPAISEAAIRAASAGSHLLSASQGDAGKMSCEQLRKDAVLTTLMLSEIQNWYQKQSTLEP